MSRPPATTFEYLQFHAASAPDRVALIMDDGEYTYGRFADDALRFTKALADLGIERRQIVTIHHPHFYIEWLLTIACENLGAVSMSDDARNWKQADYLYQHVDVGLTNTPAEEEPSFQYHWLTDDWVRATLGMDLAAAQPQKITVLDLVDLVRIGRSSGSTGIPKLIPMTRNSFEQRVEVELTKGTLWKSSRIMLISNPFAIYGNLAKCQACVKICAQIVMIKRDIKETDMGKVSSILDLPVNFESFIDRLPNTYEPNGVLTAEVIGASLSDTLRKRIETRLASHILTVYATNEVGRILLMKEPELGIIVSGTELEIRDQHHRSVGDGIPGRIAVRTPAMIDGYYKNEEETRKRFRDGWFYTGDAGIKIGPRKVKLLGRADDMVIMGGIKESPLVLEDTLRNGAGVKDAAVVGIKASDGGDLVCVALVLTDDANAEAIRADIHQLWAVYKVRVIIAVVDDLARTENGKVSRAKVRDFFREQVEAEVAAS